MADYSSMYRKIFNAVTDAINILKKTQIETEGMYIEYKPQNITLIRSEIQDSGGDNNA